MSKKICSALLAFIICVVSVEPVYASSISELQKQKNEAQNQLNQVTGKLSGLSDAKENIDDEINELDTQLVEIMTSISILEDEIDAKQEEIEIAQADYDAAKAKEEDQYQAMVTRIRFMYEKGDTSYIQLFMEAKSLGDLVNKADYVEKLYEYDRKMLEEFQKVKEEVAALKTQLEEEQSELEADEYELEGEKASLDQMLTEKKAQSADYENQIAKVKQDAAAYKAKIKQQNAQIKKLEEEAARKAAEEAAKAAAAAKANNSSNSGGSSGGSISVDTASIINGASGSATGKEIAAYACKFIGYPYVAGGVSLTGGADCSGFTFAVYQAFGISIPRTSTSQRSAGSEVSFADAQPGDLICYAGHVAMYIGGGKIVHASSAKTGIKISNATYKEILGVRRIL